MDIHATAPARGIPGDQAAAHVGLAGVCDAHTAAANGCIPRDGTVGHDEIRI